MDLKTFSEKLSSATPEKMVEVSERRKEALRSGEINSKQARRIMDAQGVAMRLRDQKAGEGFTGTETPTESVGPTEVEETVSTREPDDVTGRMEDNIVESDVAMDERKKLLEQREQETKELEEERIKQVEEDAKKEQDLIKDTDKRISEIEKQMSEAINQRKDRDVEILEQQKIIQQQKLDAERALQQQRDKEAILEAQKQTKIAQIQANVAYNKLGIAFSSGAINTSQAITQRGIEAIAGLEVQANYNQAMMAAKASELELEFTGIINKTIDTYTNKALELKQQTIGRIAETQNSLLLSEREKNNQINNIKDNYRREVQNTQDQMFSEMSNHRDNQITRTQQLEQQLLAEENRNIERVNSLMSSGEWNSLSLERQEELARKTGRSMGELERNFNNTVQAQGYQIARTIMGPDFMMTMEENQLFAADVKRLTESGIPLQEAIDRSVNNVIRRNPRYQELQYLRELEYKATIQPKPVTSGSIKTSSMKQGSDGNWYAWTGTEWLNTGLQGRTPTDNPNQLQLEDGTIVERGPDGNYIPSQVVVGSKIELIPSPSGLIGPSFIPKKVPKTIDLKGTRVGTKQETIEFFNNFGGSNSILDEIRAAGSQ